MTLALERTTPITTQSSAFRYFPPLALLLDLIVVFTATLLATAGRNRLDSFVPVGSGDVEQLVAQFGAYDRSQDGSRRDRSRRR